MASDSRSDCSGNNEQIHKHSQDYFGVCSEAAIKDNVVVVYELLEEMLDNGFPLATESNILKELIKPPTILRTVVNTITGNHHDQPSPSYHRAVGFLTVAQLQITYLY